MGTLSRHSLAPGPHQLLLLAQSSMTDVISSEKRKRTRVKTFLLWPLPKYLTLVSKSQDYDKYISWENYCSCKVDKIESLHYRLVGPTDSGFIESLLFCNRQLSLECHRCFVQFCQYFSTNFLAASWIIYFGLILSALSECIVGFFLWTFEFCFVTNRTSRLSPQ